MGPKSPMRPNTNTLKIYIYTILKHQFQRSFHVIFLQITSHIYFKLTCCTHVPSAQPTSTSQTTPPHIDGQTAARHASASPDAHGPQLRPRHNTLGHLVKLGECPCVATGTYNIAVTYIQNVCYIVMRKCFIIYW
jgi:hypothetical protein